MLNLFAVTRLLTATLIVKYLFDLMLDLESYDKA